MQKIIFCLQISVLFMNIVLQNNYNVENCKDNKNKLRSMRE